MPTDVTIPGITAIARHSWATVLVGKIVPIVVFLTALPLTGVDLAVIAALAWSIGVLGYQRHTGRRIAGLVVLSVIGNIARSALALATGSAFFYFAQPTMSTILIGIAFAISVPLGQPLAGRLIHDFCPFDPETADHPQFHRFFRTASFLWSGSSLFNGAVTIYLLSTQTLTTFLVAKAFLGPLLTSATVAIGIVLFRRRMHRNGVTVTIARRVSNVPGPAVVAVPVLASPPALAT